jgi:D-alanyl-D-alanine carboxypeptidase
MPTPRRILTAALATSTAALTVAASLATAAPTPATAEPANAKPAGLQHALDAVVAAGAVGAVAEVRTDGSTWRSTSGAAQFNGTRPNPQDLFRAGSVTKTFVATVVLQLVEEHRLALDDKLADLLPQTAGVVPNAERITVEQLLTHTSGLADFMGDLPLNPPSSFLAIRWKTWDPWDMVKLAAAHPSTDQGKYKYSNAGYQLLGMIIQRTTHHSYGAEIQHRIIERLGLRDTAMPGIDPLIHGPHLHGYLPVEKNGAIQPVDLTELNPSVFGASGELVSTPADLNHFFDALLQGRLLRRDMLELMKALPDGSTYGMGLRERTLTCGVTAYGNDGDALTYLTYSFTTKDRRRQVTVSLTPWGPDRNSTDDAVDALVEKALCPS